MLMLFPVTIPGDPEIFTMIILRPLSPTAALLMAAMVTWMVSFQLITWDLGNGSQNRGGCQGSPDDRA